MATITTGHYTYEVVDKIPNDFFVWNIGENMGTDEYIPLCEDLHPENKNDYTINPHTLKAIKLDIESVQILREAASYEVRNKRAAEKTLNKKAKSYMMRKKQELAEKAIIIFEKIS